MILITDMVLSTVTLPQDNEELLLGSARRRSHTHQSELGLPS